MKARNLLLVALVALLSVFGFSSFASAQSSTIKDDGIPYILYFDANGGIDAPAPVYTTGFEQYSLIRIPDSTPSRAGFVFAGWSKSPSGEAQYFSGDLVTFTSRESVIYAVWTEERPLVSSTDESHLVESNAEPLGEVTVTAHGTVKSSMFGGSALMMLIFGIIFIMSLAASGTLLVYRRVMGFKNN